VLVEAGVVGHVCGCFTQERWFSDAGL
jgi:hypothetical protein